MNFLSDSIYQVWKGVLQAAGALLLAAVVSWLITRIPAVREWATDWLLTLGAPSRATLTIFLGVLSLALLGLWIASRVSMYKFRMRVSKNALSLADIVGSKRKAVNIVTGRAPDPRAAVPAGPSIPDRHEKQEQILIALRNTEMTDVELARHLSLSQESVRFHIEALFDDDFLDVGSPIAGFPYSLRQKARAYLHERNKLE